MLALNQIHTGHALELARQLADNSIHTIITSPPYFGLRDYGTNPVYWPEVSFSPMAGLPPLTIPAQECNLGLETDLWAYVGHLVALFRELRRALHPMGTLWLNLGDSYLSNRGNTPEKPGYDNKAAKGGANFHYAGREPQKGLKPKDLMLIPARVALALQADGWYLRSDIIWAKPNPMPESVTDRPTKAHEYFFLLAKSERYFFDQEAIKEPVKEVSLKRLGRGVSETHKNINGASGQPPHSLAKPRLNVKFGGNKSGGYGTRLHSGNNWEPEQNRVNKRTIWTVATESFSGSHFATFPTKLITPAVLAGCPEQVCPECGGPWVRVVEKIGIEAPRGNEPSKAARGVNGNPDRGIPGGYRPQVKTTGFRPTCQCNRPDTIPGVVLDPFLGSGTTARVAIEHRRQWIGFELNETYAAELVTQRTDGVQIRLV